MSEAELTDIDGVYDKIENAEDHFQKCESLIEDAKDEVKNLVREELDFDSDIDVSFDRDLGRFRIDIMPKGARIDLTDKLSSEDHDAYFQRPLTFTINGPLNERKRIKNLKTMINEIEEEYSDGAPVTEVLSRAGNAGMNQSEAEHEIEKLKQKGEVYEPRNDHLRTT